jgi:hypothetical protein
MNTYLQLKERHQSEVNTFPMVFAFNDKQFKEGMKELGLNPEDTDKVYTLKGTGGIYRRSDSAKLMEMFDRHYNEMQTAITLDVTGKGFIFDMFKYELSNHEYVVTMDVTDALDALGLTFEEVQNNPVMLVALKNACKAQWENIK